MNQTSRYSKWTDHSKAWFSHPNLGAVRDWCCNEYSTTWEPVEFNIYRSAVPARIFQMDISNISQVNFREIFFASSRYDAFICNYTGILQYFRAITKRLSGIVKQDLTMPEAPISRPSANVCSRRKEQSMLRTVTRRCRYLYRIHGKPPQPKG